MTSRGDISRQLSQLVAVINTQDFRFEDVMPDGMQIHFQEIVALKEARVYIKEVECREKELQASNASLLTQLEAKQAEIDDQPEEFKALVVDLQQSQRQIELYKGLADHHEARAERYQRRMEVACKAQTTALAEADKVERLERQLTDYGNSVHKLLQENCTLRDTHQTEHAKHLDIIEQKDAMIVTLINRVSQLEAEQLMADEDSNEFNDQCYLLVDEIEQEATIAAEVVNSKSVKLFELQQSHDQLCSAVASELAPLIQLYDHVCSIMEAFREIFRCLSDPHTRGVPQIPRSLDGMLDAANDQLFAYQRVSDDIHTQPLVQKYSLAQQMVIQQVDEIAKAAAHTCMGVEDFKEDISSFLDLLHKHPATWATAKGQLGTTASIPVRISTSSRSSMSSFMSLTKRFSASSASTVAL
jgi:phage-related minor tail protein